MDSFFQTYWLPIILAVIAAVPGVLSLYRQIQKDRVEQHTAEADIAGKEADTAGKYEQIARSAAEDVITKSTRIYELEKKIDLLMAERDELAAKNRKLEHRVKILEDALRLNNIPIPGDGG